MRRCLKKSLGTSLMACSLLVVMAICDFTIRDEFIVTIRIILEYLTEQSQVILFSSTKSDSGPGAVTKGPRVTLDRGLGSGVP